MRQRYYDTEIKRFINQDILTGSIGDSQSLNRYAYVQGNPVSYSDPFGLSPFERLRQAFRPLHAVLNIAGIIPGPVGMLASLAQAGLYGLEGNSALAAHYLSQSLMIGVTGPVGGAVLGALSKMGPAAKVILGTVLGAQSLYTAGVAGINLYNSASKIADGLLNGDMSWLDAFCEGSMALNSAAGIYYSLKGLLGGCELALKGLDDVAANYAAKQEAWYKEHAGYTTTNLGISEGGKNSVLTSKSSTINSAVIGKGGSNVSVRTQKNVSMPVLPEGSQWERNVLNSFAGGKSTPVTYGGGTTLYRVGGKNGGFWSLDAPPLTEYQWRVDYAIKQEFCNDASTLYKITIPEGSSISGLEGRVGTQGMGLYGGAHQIYLDYRAVPSDWIEITPTNWER